MNAKELFLVDGKFAGVYYCEKCKVVGHTKEMADDCCVPGKCKECGVEIERHYILCDACIEKREFHKQVEMFTKAEKVTDWVGGVFHGEDYYDSISYLLDHADPVDMPDYVYASKSEPFVFLGIHKALEFAIDQDNAYEDFDETYLHGVDELKAALVAFNKANESHVAYLPDYTKAIIIVKDE